MDGLIFIAKAIVHWGKLGLCGSAPRTFPLAGDDDDVGQRDLDQEVDLDDYDHDDVGHLGTNWGSVALHLGSSHLAMNSFLSTSNLWMLPHCREVVVMIMVRVVMIMGRVVMIRVMVVMMT